MTFFFVFFFLPLLHLSAYFMTIPAVMALFRIRFL